MLGAAGFLSFFAMLWALGGLLLDEATLPLYGGPVLLSAALFALARRKAASLPPRDAAKEKRVGKLVGIWSAVQGVGIFIAVNIAINLGHRELIPPAIGVVVALHFLPLARGIPVPTYYATAAAMLAAGLLAILAPAVVTPALFCMAAAVILWVTLAVVIRRA